MLPSLLHLSLVPAMSNRTFTLQEPLYSYLVSVSLREPEILARLRAETRKLPNANMQIAPEQGQFMAMLAKLSGARRYIEVGTYTGYSALVVALALPRDGEVVACDVNTEWTAIARRYWDEAGVGERISLRLAPAALTLASLLAEGRAGTFDLAFIDADKTGYADYYERCLELLRPGGIVMVDNVLWDGRVAVPEAVDPDTSALKAFNRKLFGDDRIDLSLVPIGDGLTLARKR